MELKRYQEHVLKVTRAFLDRLATEQSKATKRAALESWTATTGRDFGYHERRDGLGRDLPAFCIKVPTGGGKTLLATQILGQIYATILRNRNGGGLALWIVPTDQIYKDTLKRLRDRRDPYRESLEFSVGRRIEVWEKDEIARLTPAQLADGLNILLLKLASANRETREQLKMFQDSGGNIVRHFPDEDDETAHRALKRRVPNLDMISDELTKTSLANLVRLCEPPVILDEGHKAYSQLAQQTLQGFNSSIIVELSATPPEESNVLVRVTGQELLDEQMIKLPMNIATSGEANWKTCLAKAKDKRDELVRKASKFWSSKGLLIRPIVLVQVERTGKDQRDVGRVHSEDVKEHLVERLGVDVAEIAIKSSDKDDIEGIDLLSEGCRVNWIITKSALQEGWDCPFAYILVSLNNTQSKLSVTQLVGRVLRQPFAMKTEIRELDESWVFCLRKRAREIMSEVKRALEQEGYEGDAASIVDRSGGAAEREEQTSLFRPEFRRLYKDFKGKVYLPRFCVMGDGGYEGLDYFRHLLSAVDVDQFDYPRIDWNLSDEMDRAKEHFFRITLGQKELESRGQEDIVEWEGDERVRAWLIANLPFEQYSWRELGRIVDGVMKRLPSLDGKFGLVKYIVRDKLAGFIVEETNLQTHAEFKKLFRTKRLSFYLKCVECRFEIPPEITLKSTKRLVHQDTNEAVQRSLFDMVPEATLNEYEKEIALCLDRHPEVLWWYRNEVGKNSFSIQGWQSDKIFPDFVVQKGRDGKKPRPDPTVLVVEGKGEHMVGSADTMYKREVADYFTRVGKAVSWQDLGKGFDKSTFRFQIVDQDEHGAWKDELKKLLGDE